MPTLIRWPLVHTTVARLANAGQCSPGLRTDQPYWSARFARHGAWLISLILSGMLTMQYFIEKRPASKELAHLESFAAVI
jgi:hypothetical protein